MSDDTVPPTPAPVQPDGTGRMSDAEWRYLTFGDGPDAQQPFNPSALAPAHQQARDSIDAMREQGYSGPYWTGTDQMSGDAIQELDRRLTRAELARAPQPIESDFSPDWDVPGTPDGYRLPGGTVTTPEAWQAAQSFTTMCHAENIGAQKAYDAIVWRLSSPDVTDDEFTIWASGKGWHSKQIKAALAWSRAPK